MYSRVYCLPARLSPKHVILLLILASVSTFTCPNVPKAENATWWKIRDLVNKLPALLSSGTPLHQRCIQVLSVSRTKKISSVLSLCISNYVWHRYLIEELFDKSAIFYSGEIHTLIQGMRIVNVSVNRKWDILTTYWLVMVPVHIPDATYMYMNLETNSIKIILNYSSLQINFDDNALMNLWTISL